MNDTGYDVITKHTLPLFCICILTLLLSACYMARAPIADTQSKRPEITMITYSEPCGCRTPAVFCGVTGSPPGDKKHVAEVARHRDDRTV
jgi:hypothetical protein